MMEYDDDNDELTCHNVTAAWVIMTITFFLGWMGLALNLLSFCVWSQYEGKIAMHIYLQTLTVADSIAIVLDAFVDGLDCMKKRRVFDFNNKVCIFEASFDFLTTYATYWIIAIIAIDRCVCFLYPQSYKTKFKKPKVAWTVLLVTMTVLFIPSLIMSAFVELEESETQHSMINSANCGVKQGTYYSVLLYGSVILGSGMSTAIVTACTAVIIYEIKLQQRRYTQRLNQIQSIAIPETSDQNNTSVRSTNGNTLEAVHTRQRVDTPTVTADGRRTMSVKGSMSHQNEQLTELRNLSASISVIFVVLCGTSQALSIYSHMSTNIDVKHVIADALDEFLNVCNSSINFFLYCFSSPKFRKELNRMLSRWKQNITGPCCNNQSAAIANTNSQIEETICA